MSALLIAVAALGLLLAWPRLKTARARWRPGALAGATAALAGAAFTAVRGEWAEALVLALVGVGLAFGARRRRRAVRAVAVREGMSRRDAASILGVPETAPADVVKSAYDRLIRRAHPDQGGSAGLAAQLNVARDVMLKR